MSNSKVVFCGGIKYNEDDLFPCGFCSVSMPIEHMYWINGVIPFVDAPNCCADCVEYEDDEESDDDSDDAETETKCGRVCCMVANCNETATKQITGDMFYDVYCDEHYTQELEKVATNTYKKKNVLVA